MHITKLEISNFRSIYSFEGDPSQSAIICGPNSCGKSNILRALKFAFLPSFSADRMASNFCTSTAGPNATISVTISFDQPTAGISAALAIPNGTPFTYRIKVKRNGTVTCHINGQLADVARRKLLLDEVVIVHVPPIRDLAAGGLDPFRATLAANIRKLRGTNSFVQLSQRVREQVTQSGRQVLSGSQATARNLLRVDALSVDADAIGMESILPMATINVKVDGREFSLEKLGTGHQSSVILSLYRQLGTTIGKFVLYLFEEPDNHLHPTSLMAIADELKECLSQESQAFITTHSPYLMNQFLTTDWLPLKADSSRHTVARSIQIKRGDRELRLAMGKFGLRPAESLLSKRIVVVEGPTDVTLIRELVELHSGRSPDHHDLLVVPAGGKEQVSELCLLLEELGATWIGVFDWDATEDTRKPLMKKYLSPAQVQAITDALATIAGHVQATTQKQTKAQKLIAGLQNEVARTATPFEPSFDDSILGKHLARSSVLSGTEIATLKQLFSRSVIRAARPILAKANLWLWSGAPEDILLSSAEAQTLVEQKLIHHKVLAGPVQSANRTPTLSNALHGLAHQPEVLQDVVRELHAANALRSGGWRDLVKALIA